MLPHLQPHRPRLPPPSLHPPHFQQTRASPTLAPRSQIEALPPSYDPASRHPVFFSERWRKCAHEAAGGGAEASPVAQGYCWGERGAKL